MLLMLMGFYLCLYCGDFAQCNEVTEIVSDVEHRLIKIIYSVMFSVQFVFFEKEKITDQKI